uniref:E3 ubiquitin protein ligase upl2, putative n=1 Tax=Arundo donax TaxID=35708 RepID=A0A0A9F0L9_ARUDO
MLFRLRKVQIQWQMRWIMTVIWMEVLLVMVKMILCMTWLKMELVMNPQWKSDLKFHATERMIWLMMMMMKTVMKTCQEMMVGRLMKMMKKMKVRRIITWRKMMPIRCLILKQTRMTVKWMKKNLMRICWKKMTMRMRKESSFAWRRGLMELTCLITLKFLEGATICLVIHCV